MRMMTGLRMWVAGALAVFVAVYAQAQDLKTYKGIYEKNTEEIRGGFQPKFDGLLQQYQKSLEVLKSSAVNQGDLAKTTAAIAEIDRFKKAKSLPAVLDEKEIPEIKAIQTAYVQQYATLETDMTSQLGMLTSKYEQALERLQKERVKALKLDEAKAVQQEREEAQVAIKGYAETLAALKKPAATNGTVVATFPIASAATGKTTGKQDLYMVIDLSGGKDAEKYPVTYLSDVPKDGWPDEYKTDKLVMRKIEPGIFKMGSPNDETGRNTDETGRNTNRTQLNTDETEHRVNLTKGLYIGVFEVTQKQWERVMGDWPSHFSNARYRDDRPVESVSYEKIRGSDVGANWPATNAVDATSFVGRLRERTGMVFDLPTEAQWEYACRAGTKTALNSGKDLKAYKSCPNLTKVGRYEVNGGDADPNGDTLKGTAKVGSYLSNAWGLYDMHGNVWELCLDWSGTYSGTENDPKGAPSGRYRVRRGGGWTDYAGDCRSACRSISSPGRFNDYIGLRVALTQP